MARKIGTWLIGIGCLFAVCGLAVLPGAFGPNPDKMLAPVGILILSCAMTLIAGGLYVKARTYQGAGATDSGGTRHRRRANCDRCGKKEAVIQCRVHHQLLCADCLSEHYDFRLCAYVPNVRRSGTKLSAHSQASGL
jgi:hypothetical protein